MKRQFDPAMPELMDRPQPVSAELESDLHNLRQLNRYFGSYALVLRFVRQWIKPRDVVRILDLATGSGDIPRLIVEHVRGIDATTQIDAVDQQAATVEIARRLSADYPEISFHEADLFRWGRAATYDIVLCALALHHFTESDALRLLRRCRALSRGLLATFGVYVLTAIFFREPMTRYDARVSTQRAFSFRELRSLAQQAGWGKFHHQRFRFARQAIWLDLQEIS
jgi:hypothetical protein